MADTKATRKRTFKLTAETVTAALKDPKARIVWDEAIRGFGLRVWPPTGTRTRPRGVFVFRYGRKGAPDRWLTKKGDFGDGCTAEQAREWARGKRGLLDDGIDPAGEVEAKPEDSIPTLAGYVDGYLARKASGAAHKHGKKAKASTLAVDRGNLSRIVRDHPQVAKKHLHQITKGDIEKIVRLKDHPVSGNRRLALLRHLFNVAERDIEGSGFDLRRATVKAYDPTKNAVEDVLWSSPCKDIGATKERGREPRPSPDVWPRLFAMLDEYRRIPTREELREARRRAQLDPEGDRSSVSETNPVIASLIKLQALTGARGSELRTARRSLLTFSEDSKTANQCKELPRTGTLKVLDPKEGGTKEIPLSAEAVAVVDALPRIKGCDYLFPGRSLTAPVEQTAVMHWWSRHRAEAGMEDFRLHDLRHFVAGILVKAGASLAQIGALYGHKSPTTTARYAYLDDAAKHELAATAARLITGMASPPAPGSGQ